MILLELKCLSMTTHHFNRRGCTSLIEEARRAIAWWIWDQAWCSEALSWPESQALGDIELMVNPQEPFLCLTGIGTGQKWTLIVGKWTAQKGETGG